MSEKWKDRLKDDQPQNKEKVQIKIPKADKKEIKLAKITGEKDDIVDIDEKKAKKAKKSEEKSGY